MLSALSATADVRGRRIDVSWIWSGLGTRPDFLLVRRRGAHPSGAADGYPVLRTGDLFRATDEPWSRVSRARYLAEGSDAEGGLLQATVTLFHALPGSSQPERVEVSLHDTATGTAVLDRIEEVSRVERTLPAPAPWGTVEALEIFNTPGGGPEASAGVVTVLLDHSDGVTPSRVRWEPAAGAATEVDFDRGALIQTSAEIERLTPTELLGTWSSSLRDDGWDLETALSDPAAADPGTLEDQAALELQEEFSADTGDWTREVRVADLRPVTEEASYYALFRADPTDPGAWLTERGWRATATATESYGFPARVYGLLPSVHQYYDEPTPADRGQGQLRRFLQVFGLSLDHLRSGAEGLRTRHDLAAVRGDYLPALGGWIGWETDRTAPLAVQRSDIHLAPAVYETVGTLPNIVALANRVTGWECHAKEFVHNLFLTNGPEYVPVREIWEISHDGSDFGAPVRHSSIEDRFDGRPVAATDSAGRTWLFWHSDRSGRWEIWWRRWDGGVATDPAPLVEPSPDVSRPEHSDLSPAVALLSAGGGDTLWLVWESDREGARDIWAQVYDGIDWGTPFRVTDHSAADRRPALTPGSGGSLHVFWESERRGRTDIWSRTFDGAEWAPPVRVTETLGRDREPAAALDVFDSLWLVWRRDEGGRSRLYTRVLAGGVWGPEAPLEDGPWRDESPTLARRGGELWLLWHSDRTGRWELWGRVHNGVEWGEPFQVTRSPYPDKEPFALTDGPDLRIFWRSECPAPQYRSRTVDTTDTELLRERGRLADRIHYTYDTARDELDWHARDVVGIYVKPPRGTPSDEVDDVLERAATYLEPFRPATVRLVLVPERGGGSVEFYTDGLDLDIPIADGFEDAIE